MIDKDSLCQKIKELYPDIGECGIDVNVEFDEQEGTWVVNLKKDRHELKTFLEENEAEKLLHQINHEQRAFFKKAFGKKDASPYEFDLVLNSDFITEPRRAAEIVAQAFKEKFASELQEEPFSNKNAA